MVAEMVATQSADVVSQESLIVLQLCFSEPTLTCFTLCLCSAQVFGAHDYTIVVAAAERVREL